MDIKVIPKIARRSGIYQVANHAIFAGCATKSIHNSSFSKDIASWENTCPSTMVIQRKSRGREGEREREYTHAIRKANRCSQNALPPHLKT